MKRSAAKSLNQGNPINVTEKHYIYDLIDTINSFFRAYFEGAVKVESLIEHPFYLECEGNKLSRFLSYALSLETGNSVIHIYIRELDGELNLLIGTREGFKITEDENARLCRLADDMDFSVKLCDGTLVASKKIEIAKIVPMRSLDTQNTFYDQLYCAFFGKEKGK